MLKLYLPFLASLLWLASCADTAAPASAPEPEGPKPNVLIIVADDLGWADLNCYGNPLVQSPHLDDLARRGVQFMQAYAAAPVGQPSRKALQSGLYPHRIGPGDLEDNLETLGELARQAGLRTAHVGKWGMGTPGPKAQGYDRVFAAADHHPDSYYHPFFEENPLADLLAESADGDYLTDVLTDHALDLLSAWQDSTWLLSLNFYAPHVPLEGREDRVKTYRQLVDSTHWRKFPTLEYAAMISVIDENVGRLIDFLDTSGRLENTLIIFTSDNGGLDVAAEGKLARHTPPTDNGILRAGKGTLYEGGIRVPFIVHYPDWATTKYASLEPVIATDVFPTVGAALGLAEYAESPDGRSLLPLLRGERVKPRSLVWRSPFNGPAGPASAVRRGDYKLYRDDATDSLTYFNIKALPDESLRMVGEPAGGLLRKELN